MNQHNSLHVNSEEKELLSPYLLELLALDIYEQKRIPLMEKENQNKKRGTETTPRTPAFPLGIGVVDDSLLRTRWICE